MVSLVKRSLRARRWGLGGRPGLGELRKLRRRRVHRFNPHLAGTGTSRCVKPPIASETHCGWPATVIVIEQLRQPCRSTKRFCGVAATVYRPHDNSLPRGDENAPLPASD